MVRALAGSVNNRKRLLGLRKNELYKAGKHFVPLLFCLNKLQIRLNVPNSFKTADDDAFLNFIM